MKISFLLFIGIFFYSCVQPEPKITQKDLKALNLNLMLQKLYDNNRTINFNSNKIDTSRFKFVHDIGKVPLSIKTKLDVKSIIILKQSKKSYEILSHILKINNKISIKEYLLYFNLQCSNFDNFLIIVETSNQKLYFKRYKPSFVSYTPKLHCKKNILNSKNVNKWKIKAKLSKDNTKFTLLRTKVIDKSIFYDESTQYDISKIIYKANNERIMEIHTSQFMNKNFDVKLQIELTSNVKFITIIYETFFNKSLQKIIGIKG